MSVTIASVSSSPLSAEVPDFLAAAKDYAREASAANTRRAYRAAWENFTAWCEATGRPSLPASPETVGLFLAARAGTHKTASLGLRLVAIGQAHRLAGHRLDIRHPAIRETMKGFRRTQGTIPAKKAATVSPVIRDAVDALAKRPGLRPLRDRALLLVGFAAALRRSELVALDLSDVAFVAEGMILTLRRSKTDAETHGTEIAVPFGSSERTCPVLTLGAWLKAAGIEADAIFRSANRHGGVGSARLLDRDVARVVKASVEASGYDPAA
jgi:integrase